MRDRILRTEEISDFPATPIQATHPDLVMSKSAISRALVREDEGIQKPVYYVSKSLTGAQTKYQRMEKLALAFFVTLRKLRQYFQAFLIIMLTEYHRKPENHWADSEMSSGAQSLRHQL